MDISKDISSYLQDINMPVKFEKKKDVLDKTEVKVSDILSGHKEDKKLAITSDIFPFTNNDNGNNNDYPGLC